MWASGLWPCWRRSCPGWSGKFLVLVLLGFAATGFVITMTFSAALTPPLHAIENPFLHDYLGDHQLIVTIVCCLRWRCCFCEDLMKRSDSRHLLPSLICY